MLSIFLVKSPLQLLNAIEARHAYKLIQDDCVLILMGDRKSQEQLYNIVKDDQSWGKVVSLDHVRGGDVFDERSLSSAGIIAGKRLGRLGSIAKIRKIAFKLQRVRHLFIGDYANELMRHFSNLLPHHELVLLDDGNATIKYANQRNSGNDIKSQLRISKMIKLWLKRCFLGLRDDMPDKVTYFTIYELSVKSGDKIVPNRFEFLRGEARNENSCSEIFFLGSPLVEAGILSEDEFFWHLEQVKKYFLDEKLVYVSHRREYQEKLNRIERECEIEIRQFDYPIEYQIAMVGPKPKILSAFYSSALENCRMIFEENLQICSFRLDVEHFANHETFKGEVVDNVYSYYQSNASDFFQIISLHESK